MMTEKATSAVMQKVRDLFEHARDKSGLSLQELGIKMGYEPDIARQSAFQFLKASDPRFSVLERFARAMNVPIAELRGQGHDSRTLRSGETVHLFLHPEKKKWQINSYDWSWQEGAVLQTAQVFSQSIG